VEPQHSTLSITFNNPCTLQIQTLVKLLVEEKVVVVVHMDHVKWQGLCIFKAETLLSYLTTKKLKQCFNLVVVVVVVVAAVVLLLLLLHQHQVNYVSDLVSYVCYSPLPLIPFQQDHHMHLALRSQLWQVCGCFPVSFGTLWKT